jgi:hypothetical protein
MIVIVDPPATAVGIDSDALPTAFTAATFDSATTVAACDLSLILPKL